MNKDKNRIKGLKMGDEYEITCEGLQAQVDKLIKAVTAVEERHLKITDIILSGGRSVSEQILNMMKIDKRLEKLEGKGV